MAFIREIEISNFRSINYLLWRPQVGINCLIGRGDSGKSTILDAIDLTLGARRQAAFTDADFYQLNVDAPIEVKITLGALEDNLKDIETYGLYHRGRRNITGELEPEPALGLETVLTISLSVSGDLEPSWTLFSPRAAAQGLSRDLSWAHRAANAPTRLGPYAAQHFAWGPRSILNRLSEDQAKAPSALAQAARSARQAFSDQAQLQVEQTLEQVKAAAHDIGVPLEDVQALLDIQGITFSGGSIAVHDGRGVPLRNLGLGSARLLVAGMQHRAASNARVALVDELEHGLEPYRIIRLLHKLGAKDDNVINQVFMTTHSPVVLRELSASQLCIVRAPLPLAAATATAQEPALPQAQPAPAPHSVNTAGSDESVQSTLRACAEAFLSPAVLVCEGKTEMGFIRGIDLQKVDAGQLSMNSLGIYPADGGGDNTFKRAIVFARAGYCTAVLRDDDKPPVAAEVADAIGRGVPIFQWEAGLAIENQIFKSVPEDCIKPLLDLAVTRCGEHAIDTHIQNASEQRFTLAQCRDDFQHEMRTVLGAAAKKYDWYKDIDPAEEIGRRIVGPNLARCEDSLRQTVDDVRTWIEQVGGLAATATA